MYLPGIYRDNVIFTFLSHYHNSVQFDGLLTVRWSHSGLYTKTFLQFPPLVYMGNNTLLTGIVSDTWSALQSEQLYSVFEMF